MKTTYYAHGRITWQKYCGCDYCEGHEKERRVDTKIVAQDVDEAVIILLVKEYLAREDEPNLDNVMFDVLTDQVSEAYAVEMEMRQLGAQVAPMLFEVTA